MSVEKNTIIILQQEAAPFTTMFNNVLQGIKNTAALGVYCYLASKPQGWEISKTELQNHFNCGEKHIQSCVNYLKKIGALEVISVRDEKGRIARWSWNLKRNINTECTTESTTPISHSVDNPLRGKGRTINKRILEIKDINKPPIVPQRGTGRFEEFWNCYPRKKAKSLCEKKWRALKLDDIADEILAKLRQQVDLDDEWKRGYIPNPSTYLTQQRWQDEITPAKEIRGVAHAEQWDADSVWNA